MNFRPNRLIDFQGKNELKSNLSVYIKSSIKNNKVLDHCLIYGLAGTGKTTLACCIANELNKKIKIINGATIIKNSDIINFTLALEEGDIIFIDEIHRINPWCIELLYTIMEDFVFDLNIGRDFNSKVTRIKVPNFTLIGATTKIGNLPIAFEERFGIIINLQTYSGDELFLILKNIVKKNNLDLRDDELKIIAQNAKSIPRNAIRILKRVMDFKSIDHAISISKILEKIMITEDGLNEEDCQYLMCLNKNKKHLGLKTIAYILNIDAQTIENRIEPFLLYKGYVNKENGGRKITSDGIKIINKIISNKLKSKQL
jgi:Holliday junction DNA helicase RuvB